MAPLSARWLALLLASLLAWPPSAAQAGTAPTLVVPPMAGGTANRAARSAVIRALRDVGAVSVVEEGAVNRYLEDRQSAALPARGPANTEARDAARRGADAYRRLELDKAVQELDKAKRLYRANLEREEDFDGLRAAQMVLAMAHLAAKHEDRARDELTQVIVLDPSRETRKLPEKHYSPAIRELYESVRSSVAKGGHGDLEVTSEPSGALVYVDGKAVGSSPVRVRELPVGEHFVRVQTEGSTPFDKPVMVVEGANPLPVELKPLLTIDPSEYFGTVDGPGQLDPKRIKFLDEMGIALGADIVVFLNPGTGSVGAQLYDLRSQEVSALERAGSPDELASRLVGSLDENGYVVRKEKRTETVSRGAPAGERAKPDLAPREEGTLSAQMGTPLPSPKAVKKPWYRTYWFWGAVGGAVLLSAGSVLLFTDVAKSDSYGTVRLTIP